MLSLVSRRKYFDPTSLFKRRLGLCDVNLRDYLESAVNASNNLRNVECSYKMKYARTNTLKFSYFHRVAKEWNDLPLSLRKINSISRGGRGTKIYVYFPYRGAISFYVYIVPFWSNKYISAC